MLEVSFSEIGLIGIIGILILGPNEMINILKSFRRYVAIIKENYTQYVNYLNKVLIDQDEPFVSVIFDENGAQHKAYNLEKIAPILKKVSDD